MSWTCVSCSIWTGLVCDSLFSFQAGEGSSSTHIDPSVPVTSTERSRLWPILVLLTDLSDQFAGAFN